MQGNLCLEATSFSPPSVKSSSIISGSSTSTGDSLERTQTGHGAANSGPAEDCVEADSDDAPNGGYGWVVVFGVFLVNICTWGVSNAYAIYLAHYLEYDTFPGTTRLEYAFIGGLSVSLALLMGPLATMLLRLTGTKFVIALGIVFQSGALLSCSWASKKWHLFLSQSLCYAIGHGLLSVSTAGCISQWFSTKRSAANGLATAGGGVGGLVMSLAIDRAIRNISLAWAFRMTAIVCFFVNCLALAIIKDRNNHIKPNQSAFAVKLLKNFNFQLLLSWSFFSLLGYMTILFSIADYCRSIGLSQSDSAVAAAMLNLGMVFGRPGLGYASDYFGRVNVSWVASGAVVITECALWIPSNLGNYTTRYGTIVLFALLTGGICGAFWTTIAPLCVEVVGIRDLPSALSLVWLVAVLPTTFSTAISLAIRQPQESQRPYIYPQIFSIIMYVVATLCIWYLRTRILQARGRKSRSTGEKETGTTEDNEKYNTGGTWLMVTKV